MTTSLISTSQISNLFDYSGHPFPSTQDLTNWTKLSGKSGQLSNTYVQIGLFGFDMTGLLKDCK